MPTDVSQLQANLAGSLSRQLPVGPSTAVTQLHRAAQVRPFRRVKIGMPGSCGHKDCTNIRTAGGSNVWLIQAADVTRPEGSRHLRYLKPKAG